MPGRLDVLQWLRQESPDSGDGLPQILRFLAAGMGEKLSITLEVGCMVGDLIQNSGLGFRLEFSLDRVRVQDRVVE